MANVQIPFHLGLNTAQTDLAQKPGFLSVMRGFIYAQEDRFTPRKIPGRSSALSSLPSSTNVNSLLHAPYSSATNQILALINSKIYEGDADASITLSTAQDADSPANDFVASGDYLVGVPDGKRRFTVTSGVSNERPLTRDRDGNWRYLGLKKPGQPSGAEVASAGTEKRPNANTGDWSDPANAYDDDLDTKAETTLEAAGSDDHTFYWSSDPGGNPSGDGYSIFVKLATSSLPAEGGEFPSGDTGGEDGGGESVVATLKIEVSEDYTAGTPTWATIFEQSVPVATTTIQYALGTATGFTDVAVRATLTYSSGTTQVIGYIYEVWASDGGAAATIEDGDYVYAITEVYKRTLSDGAQEVVESAGSDPVTVTTTDAYGVALTLPTKNNGPTDGVPADNHYFRIYRSVKDGTYPDLGYIGEVAASASSYTDTFSVGENTLGSPGLYIVPFGSTYIPAAGQPPASRDLAVYRGALVFIPVDTPNQIDYSLPAQPDYVPYPAHRLRLFPGQRDIELRGVVEINDVLVIFGRTRVWTIRDLPFVNSPSFNLGELGVDVLSPNAGLPGTPRSYVSFTSDRGHTLLAWVSDNGIWFTDGLMAHEQGMGVVWATRNLDWASTVDTTRLDETSLSYDQEYQIVWFDYYDPSGNQKSLALHVSALHWIQDESTPVPVPKISGPHNHQIISRTWGEDTDGNLQIWSLTSDAIYLENSGDSDAAQFDDMGTDIISLLETPWQYPAGIFSELMVFQGSLYHTDWGRGYSCDLSLLVRRDETGIVQEAVKKGVPLNGARASRFWISRAGQAIKTRIHHVGPGSGRIGPLVLDAQTMGELEQE
jgi:hypothetical protein